MKIESGGCSDVGRIRTNNEDSYRILTPLNLFVLSDGMGGEAHGEVASAIAVETVVTHCAEAESNPSVTLFCDPRPGWSERTRRLASAVHLANRKIYRSAEENEEQQGMGATLTVAWIQGDRLSVAHVGDSRAYLLRAGGLHQLTSDHSLVAEQVRRGILTRVEAEQSDMQSVLLRALGALPEIEVDTEEHQLLSRDILVMCSDGLTRMVTEPEIAGTLQAETDPQCAAERLVQLANEYGGEDNITVIVVRYDPQRNGWFSWLRSGKRGAGRRAPGKSESNGSAGGL